MSAQKLHSSDDLGQAATGLMAVLELPLMHAARMGRYLIHRELYSGGGAPVYLAAAADGSGRLVALKSIQPHYAPDLDCAKVLLEEASALSKVQHPNVCRVVDAMHIGLHPYIALEYQAGQTLAQLLAKLGSPAGVLLPADPERDAAFVAAIVAQAADGVHASHESRRELGDATRVNRDVCASNLLVSYDGHVRFMDFGNAPALTQAQNAGASLAKGKFAYLAPEQIRRLNVDRRADVWALGVCLWELLTGERLFARETDTDTLTAVASGLIRAPSRVRPELPRAFDDVVMRALARNPVNRFASCQELAEALRVGVMELGQSATPHDLQAWLGLLYEPEIARSRELARQARELATPGGGTSPASGARASGAPRRSSISADGLAPAVSGRVLKGSRKRAVSATDESRSSLTSQRMRPSQQRRSNTPVEQRRESDVMRRHGPWVLGVMAAVLAFSLLELFRG